MTILNMVLPFFLVLNTIAVLTLSFKDSGRHTNYVHLIWSPICQAVFDFLWDKYSKRASFSYFRIAQWVFHSLLESDPSFLRLFLSDENCSLIAQRMSLQTNYCLMILNFLVLKNVLWRSPLQSFANINRLWYSDFKSRVLNVWRTYFVY